MLTLASTRSDSSKASVPSSVGMVMPPNGVQFAVAVATRSAVPSESMLPEMLSAGIEYWPSGPNCTLPDDSIRSKYFAGALGGALGR